MARETVSKQRRTVAPSAIRSAVSSLEEGYGILRAAPTKKSRVLKNFDAAKAARKLRAD